MNKLAIIPSALVALSLLSAGCPKDSSGGDINGAWACISIAPTGTLGKVRPTANIDVAKKTFGGNAGCNSYFSNLETAGGNLISITGIGSTKMACEGERGAVESAFFEAIGKASRYDLKNGKLVLSDASGPLAVFEKN